MTIMLVELGVFESYHILAHQVLETKALNMYGYRY